MKTTWKTYLFWILSAEAAGGLAGILTREGTELFSMTAVQPSFSPPSFLFPLVWTILYALMGISAARIYMVNESSARSIALNIYIVQLTVNFFWSLIFFNVQAYGFAFAWILLLWVLIILMILVFYRADKTAALLQIPYLLWVSFAAVLNYAVWQLN